jgi:UDP-glucose 4-epimerase
LRILVSGASGFVGRAVTARLVAEGHEVVGLSRRPGDVDGLYGKLDANLADPAAAARISARLDPCEVVVHAAAALSGSASTLVLVNCLGTQQMLDVAQRWGVGRFIYLSSLPVIGRPLELPITEQHPAAPATPYHASKLFGEHLAAQADATILRLSAVVGAGMAAERILPTFVRRALAGQLLEVRGTGSRRQDYVDVRDVAAAVERAIEASATGCFNIAAGRAISNLDLARRCVALLESSSEVVLGSEPDAEEGLDWRVSIGRAASELGYAPTHPLEETIRALAAELSSAPSRG